MVETELACSLSSTLSGKDSLEIGSSVEAILSEESFVSVETGLVKKLSIVFHLRNPGVSPSRILHDDPRYFRAIF
jgi:hypothetical protein